MGADYDKIILAHYRQEAEKHGEFDSCTMEDDVIRTKETEIILNSVTEFARSQSAGYRLNSALANGPGQDGVFHIVDLGCGNGTTISKLESKIRENDDYSVRFTGVEYSAEMRELALKRLSSQPNTTVVAGDLRSINSTLVAPADIIILQRVLINLLDAGDQSAALENIVNLLAPGGLLIAIESFSSGLQCLNEARSEFGLEELQAANHNLYLVDGFFDHDLLVPWATEKRAVDANVFSTHYFVSRVLHDIARWCRKIFSASGFPQAEADALG